MFDPRPALEFLAATEAADARLAALFQQPVDDGAHDDAVREARAARDTALAAGPVLVLGLIQLLGGRIPALRFMVKRGLVDAREGSDALCVDVEELVILDAGEDEDGAEDYGEAVFVLPDGARVPFGFDGRGVWFL